MTLDVLSCCLALTDLDAKWVVNSHSGDTLVFNISFVLALLYCTLLTYNWETVIPVFNHQNARIVKNVDSGGNIWRTVLNFSIDS